MSSGKATFSEGILSPLSPIYLLSLFVSIRVSKIHMW